MVDFFVNSSGMYVKLDMKAIAITKHKTSFQEYAQKALYLAQNREEILKFKSKFKDIKEKNLLQSSNVFSSCFKVYTKLKQVSDFLLIYGVDIVDLFRYCYANPFLVELAAMKAGLNQIFPAIETLGSSEP